MTSPASIFATLARMKNALTSDHAMDEDRECREAAIIDGFEIEQQANRLRAQRNELRSELHVLENSEAGRTEIILEELKEIEAAIDALYTPTEERKP